MKKIQDPYSVRPEDDGDNAPFVDVELIKNYLGFVQRAVYYRRTLAAFVFAAVVVGTVLVLVMMPKTYHCETKLLAQRNQVLSTRSDGAYSEGPTRAAPETIMRRDNLVALVQQTDLVHESEKRLAPGPRIRAAISSLIGGRELPEEDKIAILVETLEKKLSVSVADGTVTISIDWPDPQMAFQLVELSKQNWLEARHVWEISTIAESISILEGHAARFRGEIDDAIDEIKKGQKERAEKNAEEHKPEPAAMAATAGSLRRSPRRKTVGNDPELADMKVMMEAKKRALAELEDFRRRRSGELQTKLSDLKAMYTDSHPAVADLQQSIEALSHDSPQLLSLRSELKSLEIEMSKKLATGEDDPSNGSIGIADAVGSAVEIPRFQIEPSDEKDPSVAYAHSQLNFALDKYQSLRSQIQTAKVELDTAQAAFKYRYTVILPVELPRKPIKPKPLGILLAAVLGGVLLGIAAAVFAELRSGRLTEKWQVEQLLKLPVLAEVDLPVRRE